MSVRWVQACPELECWTKATIFLGPPGFQGHARQAPKGEAPRPGIQGRWQVERRVALVPDILSHHLGRGSPMAKRPLSGREEGAPWAKLCSGVCPQPWGEGSGADGLSCSCSSPAFCPQYLHHSPMAWRAVVPLSGVLPGAVPWEAAALGSGLAGLAVSP